MLDNRGFGCINRLQRATGGESFNNLLAARQARDPARDRLRGARQEHGRQGRESVEHGGAGSGDGARARKADRTSVIVIETDPDKTTEAGGFWWDVAVPEVSERPKVRAARKAYEKSTTLQRVGD